MSLWGNQQDGASQALSHLLAPCSVNGVFAWVCNARSLISLHILVTRYLLGHRLLCVVYLYGLYHEDPDRCCPGATFE